MAAALAEATRVRTVVLGRMSLRDLTFSDVGVGTVKGSCPVVLEEALAEVASIAQGTIAVRSPLEWGEAVDVDFSIDGAEGEPIAWVESERCLLGIWRRAAHTSPFVALISAPVAPADGRIRAFPRWQRHLARLALIYETERLAWIKNSDGSMRDEAVTNAILRTVGTGLMVVRSDGSVLRSNAMAESWLNAHGAVRLACGRLTASDPKEREQIRAALHRSTVQEPRRPALLSLPSRNGARIAALMAFVPLGDATLRALVICGGRWMDPKLGDMVLDALGLTLSERRLARILVQGRSIEDAAKEANITISTARSYLKRIFSKNLSEKLFRGIGALT